MLFRYLAQHIRPATRSFCALTNAHSDFKKNGFAVIPSVLSPAMVKELNELSSELCANPKYDHLQEDKFTGSLIPVCEHSDFADLIAHQGALDAFAKIGWPRGTLRWMSGFLISKPGKAPSLGWHQDGWYWDTPTGYWQKPVQFFAMYYLCDTGPDNGCLRVIPGTHLTPHPLHNELGRAHSAEVRSADTPWHELPEHFNHPDSVSVPVKAGDLVIGDARVLHGAWPNTTDTRRSLITLWYHPDYDGLPQAMRENIAKLHLHFMSPIYHGSWSLSAVEKVKLQGLLPDLFGQAPKNLDKDSEYDHNLTCMDRTPGHCSHASEAAAAAYAQYGKNWA